METVISVLIPAIVENVFGALTEAVGLSDWLRQRLGRDPEKLAFDYVTMQAVDFCSEQTQLGRGQARNRQV